MPFQPQPRLRPFVTFATFCSNPFSSRSHHLAEPREGEAPAEPLHPITPTFPCHFSPSHGSAPSLPSRPSVQTRFQVAPITSPSPGRAKLPLSLFTRSRPPFHAIS